MTETISTRPAAMPSRRSRTASGPRSLEGRRMSARSAGTGWIVASGAARRVPPCCRHPPGPPARPPRQEPDARSAGPAGRAQGARPVSAHAHGQRGAGTGASRLVSGNMTLHRRLEERLATFKGTQSAVLFGSGYLANLGVIPALARPGEIVFSDELNHASIIDGCRLAGAETFVYRHADVEHLAWALRNSDGRGALIVTDGVFSMDGDVAPLEQIVELARRHDVRVMVDDA